MEQPNPFPHRQLLGWIYLGLGLLAAYTAGKTFNDGNPMHDPDVMVIGFMLIVILSLFSLLCLVTGYNLVTNKSGARRLTFVVSAILLVVSGLLLPLLSSPLLRSGSQRYFLLLLLALGIYGIMVARRLPSLPRSEPGFWRIPWNL